MKVPVSWLHELCPTDLSVGELAELLTFKGAKVESMTRPWEGLSGVVVSEVVEVREHPGADTLCLARVRHGSGERELVVGVRNMKPGDKVPLAGPGASVPGLTEPLSPRRIRGVVSEGMLCSPRELGISPDHQGILILPPDTPVGADVKSYFGLDDVVLDIEVTPNRPDFMSVLGIAREVAAATGRPLTVAPTELREEDPGAEELASLEVLDAERCPLYVARIVRGVTARPSPIRVQARLSACGMRPLSGVVDATNYVMLERGQPLHPFDLARLAGPGIVVRRAGPGERLVTLDDVERRLEPEDLVIADRDKGVAIAGVMGSAGAEVSSGTTDVLLESANFERAGILRTARRLKLQTEASARFERGADPEAAGPAADRALQLIVDWAGGMVATGTLQSGRVPERRRVDVRPARASMLLGYQVTDGDARAAFQRLGMPVAGEDGALHMEVPGYRVDIEREVDLIEEIARVQGYERVGTSLPRVAQPGGVPHRYAFRRRVREALVRSGLRETASYSFASQGDLELMGAEQAIRVANPLAADEAFLRTSLIPALVRALQANLARQVRGAALFEVGKVFGARAAGSEPVGEGPVPEAERAAFGLAGRADEGYPEPPREADFLDAKGVLESLLDGLAIEGWTLGPAAGMPFHPARSSRVEVGGEPAGVIGELHPRLAERLDFTGRVALGELDLGVLDKHAPDSVQYRDIPRFPPTRRDLAFVVQEDLPSGEVRRAIMEAAGGLADSVVLFDAFTGGPISPGKKSLAFSVDFRAPDRTLTDEEAERAVRAIAGHLMAAFGAELRAG